MHVTGLHHLNITFPEGRLDEALAFYRDLLGLAELERPEGAAGSGAWLQTGGQPAIEVHLTGEADGDRWPVRSSRHLGLLVTDLEEARARLEGAGCSIEPARPLPNRDRFFVRDPFGNRVEILAFRGS